MLKDRIIYFIKCFLNLTLINFIVMLFVRWVISPYIIFGLSRNEMNFWTKFDILNTFLIILPFGIALGLILSKRMMDIYGVE